MSKRVSTDEMTGSKDEAASLVRFLDFQRDTVIGKIEGLDREAAARSPVPSGTSLLGLVKHLTHVERFWFQAVFTGRDVAFPWTDEDPDADWRPGEEETVDQAVSGYREAIAASQEAIAGASLDDVGRYRDREFTLRWIMLHMIEETARHAGHADIIREQVDGTTGF